MGKNNRIISIEGNIGSGKTTFLEELRKAIGENVNVIFLKEPVDAWENIKDKKGETMLQKFYKDQEKYSFSFQMMAFISRLSILKSAMLENENSIIITERSLYTDKMVFAKMLYEQSKIEDINYQIYLCWFDEFVKECPIDYVFYIKADPENCYDRVQKRSRIGESVIPIEYLFECHIYHEEFLSPNGMFGKNQIIFDGNIDIVENKNIMCKWIDDVIELLVNMQY